MAGNIEWESDNYMIFYTECPLDSSEEEEDAFESESHSLEWHEDPHTFAVRLRHAADWLEAHRDAKIRVDID